jgi:hypothetical protein
MPDVMCVKRGDKSFCLNFETGQVDVCTKSVVSVDECPKDVVRELVYILSERLKEKQRNAVGG